MTLIPGDGIGPELLNHVREVFRLDIMTDTSGQGANDAKVTGRFLTSTTCLFRRFSCVPVDFEVVHVNSALETQDDMDNAIMAIRRNGVALKGKKSPLARSSSRNVDL